VTLEEFAEITRHVIAADGFDEYLPTVCYPSSRNVKTLVGLPNDIEPEPEVLEWAEKSAKGNEEFLVAFKVDAEHFKVIRRVGPFSEEQVFPAESTS